jgi:hypothetical protein
MCGLVGTNVSSKHVAFIFRAEDISLEVGDSIFLRNIDVKSTRRYNP